MADNKDPFAEFGGSLVTKDKDPFAEFGGSKLRGKPLDTDLPTGTQTSKRGFEPFLPQVPTKTPSVLLSDEQKQQREKQRIGERFETTLLNVPTEFGKVDQFMRSAKKVKDTLPQIPTIKPSTGGMVVIPQGEKIGDSLRKGDTLQDELTDKLTGKKTALQKQIESAQEAFRTVQGDEVADQARAQTGKEPTAFETGYENIAPLMSGLQGTVSSFYKIPRYIYDVFAIPQNLVADLGDIPGLQANYENVSKGTFNPLGYLEYAGRYTKGEEEKWQSRQRQYDEDIATQLFSTGDFGGAALQIFDNVVASAPSIAAMFVSGGTANAAKLGSISSKIATALPFASAQNQALVENENIPQWLKPVNAAFNGLAEILLEGRFGTTAILSGATKVIAEQGAEAATKSIKDFAYNYIKKVLSKVQPVTDVVSNTMEEMATTLSQNIIARATGEDPNRGIMDGVADAGIVGGAQGAGASAIRKGLDVITNKKSKDKVEELSKQRDDIVNDLDNDAIPNSVKEQLEVKLEGITEELNNTLDENRNEINNLPEETKLEVAELADKIETIKESLQNETISETSKAILEQDLKDAQAELDAKFKLAKPTFDTEEQLVEEIRAAEKEFNETGDSAEYQLKINDLNTRLENLVPAPEGAEIGKPEVAALKDVEATAKALERVDVVQHLRDKINSLRDEQGNIPKDKMEEFKALRKASGAVNDGLVQIPESAYENTGRSKKFTPQQISEAYHEAKADGSNPELVKAVEELITPKPKKDAVSQSISSKVPVLTEAPVGEEVEQGKPQPKAKFVAEEGKEEINPIDKDKGFDNPDFVSYDGMFSKEKATSISQTDIIADEVQGAKGYHFFYKGKKSRIEMMSPDEYLKRVREGFKTNKDENILDSSKANINEGVEKGDKIDMPSLDYSNNSFNQEGRNRSLFAKERGEKLIPVLIIEDASMADRISKAKEILSSVKTKENTTESLIQEAKNKFNLHRDAVEFMRRNIDEIKPELVQEKTPAQEVKRLRAKEQAELYDAIPNADQYLTDGKVDRDKLTDPKDLNKFDDIYDKYDKLITPLLPKSETKAGSVGVGDGLDYVRNKFSESESGGKQLSDKESKILNKEVDRLIERAEKENGVKRNELKQATWKTNDGYTITEFFENGSGGTRIITPKGEEINLFDNKYKSQSGQKISYFPKAHKAVEQSLKETPKAEPTPAKPKTEPRLKPRVETRIKFTKAIELFNDISAADGAAKKGTLARKRQKFLAQNPSIKYIDDNWRKISDQLKAKGLIETKGNCP